MARILLCAPLLLALLAISFPATAQDSQASSSTTRLILFTAALPDAGPDAIAGGARTVTFALFDETEGGTLLWSETQIVSVDARGRYSAHLGAVTALPLAIFRTEQARWLEVSIDGTAQPRVMLVAVPYALRAADAETLGGTPASGFVRTDADGRRVRADGTTIDDPTVDGTGVPGQLAKWSSSTTLSSSIITESFDNRIGVFAPDPTGGGVVDSRFTIRHLDNNTALGVLNTSNQRRFALNTLSTGGFRFFDGAGGTWNGGMTQANGRIGIGTTSPITPLHVIGSGQIPLWVQNFSGQSMLVQSSGRGIETQSGNEAGLAAFGSTGVAALAAQSNGTALAGLFNGDVDINGTVTKTAGSFRIDHPLDPANKYLSHSFVESPDMMNVYNGNATLDAKGEAWVTMPDWFEPLNRDFRYQLTPIGAPGPNLYIAEEVANNRFKIAGGAPGGRVSWQVTGIRHDAFANRNRIPVEHDKPAHERGFYLNPAAFDLPPDMRIPSRRLVPTTIRQQ